jgi:hypothetical protein
MSEENKPGSALPSVADELQRLGQSFSSLGRTLFREGGTLTAELLKSLRGVVDRAREEIERMTSEKR